MRSTPTAARAQAPLDFRLKTTDGGEITSEMVRGDVVVLAFGSSLLGPLSKQQVQGVQELAEQFGERDVRVYWVTTDSDKPQARNYATDEQLRTFASKAGLKAAVLRDPDGALFIEAIDGDYWNVVGLPVRLVYELARGLEAEARP